MNTTTVLHNNLNPYTQQQNTKHKESSVNKEINLEQTLESSAISVQISMNAQYVLMQLESFDQTQSNFLTQAGLSTNNQDVLNFLSGEKASNGLSLKDIGYEGKPILELNQKEAKELISEDGFFGVTQTSNRVANFVFSFSGENIELLQKGREGIIQGFEEAKRLFGGELPEISYQTQERTLNLIDEKIDKIQGTNNS